MIKNIKFSILVIFFLIAVALGWWATFNNAQKHLPSDKNAKQNSQDVFITDVTYLQIDKKGKIYDELTAAKVTHYTLDDEYTFTSPRLKISSSENNVWKINSLYGKSKNQERIIDLFGDVNINQFANNSTTPILKIKTSSMVIYPQEKYAHTKDALTIEEPDGTLKAVGAKLNFETNVLHLFSKIEVLYSSVSLNADKAYCEQKQKSCLYSGNVKLKHKDSYILASNMLVYVGTSNTVEKIVASGNPARYYTEILHNGNKAINSLAKTIIIYPQKNKIIMKGNVEVTQKQNKFTSEYVEYDLKKKTILSLPGEKKNMDNTKIILKPDDFSS